MATVKKEVHIERPPDAVWAVVGDLGSLSWVPGITKSTLEGDTRTCSLEGDGALTEKILLVDAAARRYEYTITESPMPISSHQASMEVVPDGTGSRLIWATEVEPDDLAPIFDSVAEGGAQALKKQLEG